MADKADAVPIGDKVIKVINSGRVDDRLQEVIDTAVTRARYLRAVEAYERVQKVKVNDRIRIRPTTRPRYLAGKTGTVVGISGRTRAGVPLVEVKLDRPVGKFTNGMILLHGSSFDIYGHLVAQSTPDGRVELMS